MHFIHLNVNSLVLKTEKIQYLAKLTDASVIGISVRIEGYNLKRIDRSRKVGGVAFFIKDSAGDQRSLIKIC